jgi:hypothetical protein
MKDAFYFPHFSNARTDRKIKRLIKALGIEGYGIYFMLLEVLREQTEFRYPISDIDLLADEFGTSVPKIEATIKLFGLFEIDEEEMFFSLNLIKYLEPMFKAKEQRSIAGKASAEARRQKLLAESNENERPFNDRSTDDEHTVNEIQQKKRNDTKEKNTYSEEFEIAWEMYKRKGNKKPSMKQWDKLSEQDKKIALEHIPRYAKAHEGEIQFMKNFESYLHNEAFHSIIVERNTNNNKATYGAPDFPWPKHINIHDAYTVMKNNTQRVDCDFPHDLARAWFRANTDWRQKYGGER